MYKSWATLIHTNPLFVYFISGDVYMSVNLFDV